MARAHASGPGPASSSCCEGPALPSVHDDDRREWWQALSPRARERLRADPHGSVPVNLWGELSKAGHSPIAAWWPSVQTGPDGFYLPDDPAEYVEGAPAD